MKLTICAIINVMIISTTAYPGLLRVPKVYNAVITSNQNLSPSRAFPVIQPVIHRTAIGYVPPFYYAQIAPHFTGPEVIHLPEGSRRGNEGNEETKPEESTAATNTENRSEDRSNENEESNPSKGNRNDKETGANGTKKKNEDVPLSFYPNYHSLYYNPYFYTYNTFEPHPIPSTYYVDYQPYGPLAPIPASPPPKDVERLLPGYHDEEKKEAKAETKEKIPDVPPPPLPTAVPKST